MTKVSMSMPVTPEDVFAVLADGWLYTSWVVGASHIRGVDDGWPEQGAQIHHSAGAWPLLIKDVTVVHAVERPWMLDLRARLWPLGEARVRLDLKETSPGSTEVIMTEYGIRGLGRVIPDAIQSLALVPRNRESLGRLRDLAVGKARG
jgi:hypothetical protein